MRIGYLLIGVDDVGRLSGYRNPIIAASFKTLGYVNMFNRGVREVQNLLKENGNLPAVFDVSHMTAFEATVYAHKNDGEDVSSRGVPSRGVPSRGVLSQDEPNDGISDDCISSPDVLSRGVLSQGVPSQTTGLAIVSKSILRFCTEPKSLKEIAEYLGVTAFKRIKTRYINVLLEEGKLRMAVPDKPTSRFQKYVTV